jgi:hypothetical protein
LDRTRAVVKELVGSKPKHVCTMQHATSLLWEESHQRLHYCIMLLCFASEHPVVLALVLYPEQPRLG